MDISEIIQELHAELARLNEAIETLERLENGMPRRGRPPGWLAAADAAAHSADEKLRKKPAKKAARS
jgi:hypothetical protein